MGLRRWMCIKKATDMKVCLIICLANVGSSGQAAEDYQIHRQSRMYRSAKESLSEPKGFSNFSQIKDWFLGHSNKSDSRTAQESLSEPKGFRIDSDSRHLGRIVEASPPEPKEDTPRDK